MSEFKYENMWGKPSINIDEFAGLVFTSIDGLDEDSEEVLFTTQCGRQFKMYHEQDCCESVYITDVCGDVEDILNSEVIHFEERTNGGDEDSDDKPHEYSESWLYTFYDIQTLKGSVNIRWLGESNGYYSESVNIVEGERVE